MGLSGDAVGLVHPSFFTGIYAELSVSGWQGSSGRRLGTAKRGAPGWDSPATLSGLCKAAALARFRPLLQLQHRFVQQQRQLQLVEQQQTAAAQPAAGMADAAPAVGGCLLGAGTGTEAGGRGPPAGGTFAAASAVDITAAAGDAAAAAEDALAASAGFGDATMPDAPHDALQPLGPAVAEPAVGGDSPESNKLGGFAAAAGGMMYGELKAAAGGGAYAAAWRRMRAEGGGAFEHWIAKPPALEQFGG